MELGTYTIHRCVMPLGDCFRLWIGNDPSKYVDYHGPFPAHAIAKWFEKYGNEVQENHQNYYPQKARGFYLFSIREYGYSEQDAQVILLYLPQIDRESKIWEVDQMIDLWKKKAPLKFPDDMDPVTRKILMNEPNYWDSEPYSPLAARARLEGRMQALAEKNDL